MTSPQPRERPTLSIGEAARLAGVTARAVRHYHASGVLPEPARDGSGYRRYGVADVIALVRIVRLRAVGMPIPQIASRLGASEDSPAASLRALVDDIDREIERLSAARDRLHEMAASETFEQPAETLARALRERGLLGAEETLPAGESWAASLLDALHPQGMPGLVDQARRVLDGATAVHPLLERFRALPADAPDSDVESLASDAASVLPRPDRAAPPVDVEVMDKLLGDRLNAAQRRFMRLLRQRMAQQ